ncbi:hypothetical protein OSB04_025648 [Centaurea solstitialis]|uniref:Uncharacterized protein n=1 Tax=Centaurea solstitialis TaxID=347529 RepID=A0AA38T1V5_9ASTR|nr:hypothetical protein OSB04_025648 [Centaurea solstitialis]
MLAYDEVHAHTISSQSKLHSFEKPTEFTFPDILKTKYHHKHDEKEHPFGFSPPLWSQNVRSNDAFQQSSMMAQGRKELMDMTNDLPESCYELSLKDIVMKDLDKSGLMMEEKIDTKPKVKEKKKSTKRGSISRSASLDTGFFHLKMFFPISSFGSRKYKQTSRSTSMDGLKKQPIDVKQFWKTWLFVESDNSFSIESLDNNKYCTATTKTRYEEGRWNLGCNWFTNKSGNQKGCIFF